MNVNLVTTSPTVLRYDGVPVAVAVGAKVWVKRDQYATTISRIERDRHGFQLYLYEGGGYESRYPLWPDQLTAY
jgi:hypothetical protein